MRKVIKSTYNAYMVTLIFKVFVDLWGSENAFSDYCSGNSLQFKTIFPF